jgi:hypothetical protein
MPVRPTKKSAFLAVRRGNQKQTALKLGAGSAVTSLVKKLPTFAPAPRDMTQVVGTTGTRFATYEPQGVLQRKAREKPRLVLRAPNKTERETAALVATPARVVSTSAPVDLKPASQPVGSKLMTSPAFWIAAGIVVAAWAFKGGGRP